MFRANKLVLLGMTLGTSLMSETTLQLIKHCLFLHSTIYYNLLHQLKETRGSLLINQVLVPNALKLHLFKTNLSAPLLENAPISQHLCSLHLS